MSDKYIESHQMWGTLIASATLGVGLGINHASFSYAFMVFWLTWPVFMILSAIYNWIVE